MVDMNNHRTPKPQKGRSNSAHAQENTQTITSLDSSYYHYSSYGVRPPLIEDDYEINLSLIGLILDSKFLGLEIEDPYDHMDYFERLCSTFRFAGVPDDTIKLNLFRLSLGEEAWQWARGISIISSGLVNPWDEFVNSWDDYKKLFLLNLCSKQHAQENTSTIGSLDDPCYHYHESRYGIRLPPIEANAYQSKPSMIKLIQDSKLLGLRRENPYDHLDYFERLCSTFRIECVPGDSIKLILFPLSFGGKASLWERAISSDLVNSWDDCKKNFLLKFRSGTRLGIENRITSTQIKNQERFWSAFLKIYDCFNPFNSAI